LCVRSAVSAKRAACLRSGHLCLRPCCTRCVNLPQQMDTPFCNPVCFRQLAGSQFEHERASAVLFWLLCREPTRAPLCAFFHLLLQTRLVDDSAGSGLRLVMPSTAMLRRAQLQLVRFLTACVAQTTVVWGFVLGGVFFPLKPSSLTRMNLMYAATVGAGR
jgi:hypothetical protein